MACVGLARLRACEAVGTRCKVGPTAAKGVMISVKINAMRPAASCQQPVGRQAFDKPEQQEGQGGRLRAGAPPLSATRPPKQQSLPPAPCPARAPRVARSDRRQPPRAPVKLPPTAAISSSSAAAPRPLAPPGAARFLTAFAGRVSSAALTCRQCSRRQRSAVCSSERSDRA
jgi:hypothetical protein